LPVDIILFTVLDLVEYCDKVYIFGIFKFGDCA